MKTFYTFILLLISSIVFSQDAKSHDQLKALKIAHLATELNLNSSEAEKFWPLYNVYDQKMYDLRHNEVSKFIQKTEINKIKEMSEIDANRSLKDMINFEAEYFSVRKQFIQDAQKILSAKKIILLKKAEDDFNRKLLKEYKKRK